MLTIKEVAKRLGIDSGSQIGDLGQASALLKYFGIKAVPGNRDGKMVNLFDGAEVDLIAQFKATEFARL